MSEEADILFGSFQPNELDLPCTVILPQCYRVNGDRDYVAVKERSTAAVPAKASVNKWRDLFGTPSPMLTEPVTREDEPKEELEAILPTVSIHYSPPVSVSPRGLNNEHNSNKCFLNCVLQCLVATTPLSYLVQDLRKSRLDPGRFPYLSKLSKFFREFKTHPADQTFIKPGIPFTPDYFYDTLTEFNPVSTTWQEDAQEYMCFLLDKFHQELHRASKNKSLNANNSTATQESKSSNDDSENWTTVLKGQQTGGKNRATIILTKGDEFATSVITRIFGGTLQSIVTKQGQTASARVEPFFCLHLDIHHQSVNSVYDALDLLTAKEKIEGYQDDKKGIQIPASKQLKISTLPSILLIHLKRFAYEATTGGVYKVRKYIQYPLSLHCSSSWVAHSSTEIGSMKYRLFAVISHLGPTAQGGHYTCDIYHHATKNWVHYDDSKVSTFPGNTVTSTSANSNYSNGNSTVPNPLEITGPLTNPHAYLLCYQKE